MASPLSLRTLALVLLLGCAATAATNDAPAKPPNVLLIVADDLGYGDLGCYGQERLATPRLDALAHEGRLFTQFYAGSTVCAPSRCALMTGLHTGHCRIRGNARQNLAPEDVTIAEVLKEAGYTTGLVGKWGIGHEGTDGMPTRQGFDSFFGYLDQAHAHNFYTSFLLRDEERVLLPNVVPNEGERGQGVATVKKVYSHDLLTEEALAFLEREKDGPFFLYLAYTIPHANNEAGKKGMEVPELGPWAETDWPAPEQGFAAMVERLDRDVGRLLDRLDELGLAEDTLVLFTSDNGPHSEGGHRADYFASNGPLSGKKRDLLEGGIRVPLLARWPGRVPAGTRSDHVAAFWDLMPTFAELAGAPPPSLTDGVSMAAALRGDEEHQAPSSEMYWSFYEGKAGRALRHGRWKLVEQPLHSPARLYDLTADPAEEHDLAPANPELARELSQRMTAADVPTDRWRLPDPPTTQDE